MTISPKGISFTLKRVRRGVRTELHTGAAAAGAPVGGVVSGVDPSGGNPPISQYCTVSFGTKTRPTVVGGGVSGPK